MADFCKDCSIELFGEDFKELANIAREGEAAQVLCESCGYIWVNSKGEKIKMDTQKVDKILELCGEILAHNELNEPLLINDEWVNSLDAAFVANKILEILGYNKEDIQDIIDNIMIEFDNY